MTALVTGAAGFLGHALCRALSERGVATRAVWRAEPVSPLEGNIVGCTADLRNPADWDRLLEGVDTVYHLAWTTTPAIAAADPAADLTDNLAPLVRLLEAARTRPGLRVVFPSSGGTVYGVAENGPAAEDLPTRPINAYGIAKLAAEHYIDLYRDRHGVDAIALRIGNPYGLHQRPEKGLGAVSTFTRAAVEGRPVVLFGDGSIVRDYVHVDDVATALLEAGMRRGGAGPINIGSGTGRSLIEVIETIEHVLARPVQVERRPGRPFDVPVSVLDIRRAREQLGWLPVIPFEDGVRALADRLRQGPA